ncbi:MAG TPA: POTRA domain-containing protein [Pirellulales bacterium]|nr:POTRA domain-containing protein [Pirellulales bacterium]
MVGEKCDLNRSLRACLAAATAALACGRSAAIAQLPPAAQPAYGSSAAASGQAGSLGLVGLTGKEVVVDVRVEGVPEKELHNVVRYIRTHEGRPFDPQVVQSDVRRLLSSKRYAAPVPSYQRVGDNGIVVIFHVVELPTIKYVVYRGSSIKDRHLNKKTNLKKGDPIDVTAIQEGRRNLEEYFHEKGFTKATVSVVEGLNPKDRGVVYLINEGVKQKILYVSFENNSIASDGRLKTQISSKPPLLYLFKGEFDRQKIEQDERKLADYYRSMGFFAARVGHEIIFTESQKWVDLRFVIDEGPRYKVRAINFAGEKRFHREELLQNMHLKSGEYFDIGKREHDVNLMQDMYGGDGYVFATIEPDQRFSETGEPELEMVYHIEEGERYAVGDVNVKILGEYPHTRRNTILNRVSLHPGDIFDIRELRSSERRLKASNLFANQNPSEEPKITFERPDDLGAAGLAENPDPSGKARGQSPDDVGRAARRPAAPSRRPAAQGRPAPPAGRGTLAPPAGRGTPAPRPQAPPPGNRSMRGGRGNS